MELFKLKCPQCDADLEIENGIDSFYCKYCGCRLLLDGQSRHVVAAKVRQKELEHERYKMNFEAAEKEKEYKREKEKDKSLVTGLVALMVIPLLLLVLLAVSSSVSEKREERSLIKLEEEVRDLISKGEYDEALTKVEKLRSVKYDSSETKKKWDKTREALIKEIKAKQKTYVEDFGIPVPLSSSDAKGMDYNDVKNTFEDAGFTNITVNRLNEKSGLFSKAGIGDVKQISIDGDKSFREGTKFIANSSVVIDYYGLE